MNLLLEQDKSFNLDKGYQTQVIEKGVLHGKRFMGPLLFSVATFNSTEEILSQSSFQGLSSYDCKTFCEYANEFLDANPQMALFNNTTTQYRAIVQSLFSILNLETLKSEAFREVIEVCHRNTQRQEELGINAEDLMRPYFAMESGKYLFYCGNDNQDLKRLGSFSSLGSPTYFTLSNESGTLNGDILFFASINAKSENLQNAWDFMKLLLTQYQDVAQYMPEAKRGTSMNGELGKSVLLSGNQGIVNQFQTFTPPLLNYLNEDNSFTQIPMAPVPEAVAQAYINLAQQVGEAYFNYSSAQVMSYFDAYIAGEKSYETCLEDAISYVTVHESE